MKKIYSKNQVVCLLSAICICFNGCGRYKEEFTQDYETTVKVIDIAGQALKNRQVTFSTNSSSTSNEFNNNSFSTPFSSMDTDVNGNAVFKYTLIHRLEWDTPDFYKTATFTVEDEDMLKAINYNGTLFQKSADKVIKNVVNILMDSLVTVKVRVQKTNATILTLRIYCASDSKVSEGKPISQIFLSGEIPNIGLLDSTFTFKAYSKTKFNLSITGTQSNNTSELYKTYSVSGSEIQNTPLLIKL